MAQPWAVTHDFDFSKRRRARGTYLSELTQRGKLGQRRQLYVGHAKELQFFKGIIQTFDFAVAGSAVVEHQLRHLPRGQQATRQLDERQKKPAHFI